MTTFTKLHMAASVVLANGQDVIVNYVDDDYIIVLTHAEGKRPEELATRFVRKQEHHREDDPWGGAMLLGWAGQDLDVFWCSKREHWYAMG